MKDQKHCPEELINADILQQIRALSYHFLTRIPTYNDADIEDAAADIAEELMKRLNTFNPQLSSFPTFVTIVAQSKILKIIRFNRQLRRSQLLRVSLNEPVANIEAEKKEYIDNVTDKGKIAGSCQNHDETTEAIELKIAVDAILNQMPEHLAYICELLLQEYTVTEIAQILEKRRTTIYWHLRQIRKRFRRAGFKQNVASKTSQITS